MHVSLNVYGVLREEEANAHLVRIKKVLSILKGGEFLDKLSAYQRLKEDSASWN
jgi:hypothetical protein